MTGFVLASIVVIYLAVLGALLIIAMDGDNPIAFIGAALWLTLGLGIAFQSAINADRKGPCVTYEMRMVYDPALKIARQARVCAERGEWVE